MTIEIRRTGPGQFQAYRDGRDTGYQIVNGSLGLSGRSTPNAGRRMPSMSKYSIRCELLDGTLTKPGEWRGTKRVARAAAEALAKSPAPDVTFYLVWDEDRDRCEYAVQATAETRCP